MARPRTTAATTAENKKIIKQFFETVVNQRKVNDLPKFVASDGTCGGKVLKEMVINPDPTAARLLGTRRIVPATRPGAARERTDVAAFRDFTKHVLDAFPDMKVKITSILADGDQVVVRWTATGTHKGEFLGTPPTGRKVPMTNVDIFTLKDGMIVGVQAHPDGATVLTALGHAPATPLAETLGFNARGGG